MNGFIKIEEVVKRLRFIREPTCSSTPGPTFHIGKMGFQIHGYLKICPFIYSWTMR
jgi:hypothetical protein